MQARLFSLKWKALGALSLVLIGGIVTLSWLSYAKLSEQFIESQAAEGEGFVREIRAMLHQVEGRLEQLASWFPALEGMGPALRGQDPAALDRLFARHWPAAQLVYDLQSVSFFGLDGRLAGHWDDGSTPLSVPAAWIEQVNQDERPLFTLTCVEQCHQVGVLPLLVDRERVGVLALSVSVAELILGFREVTGRDIGVLTVPRPGEASTRVLPEWNLAVTALSDAEHRLPLLRLAALRLPQLPTTRVAQQFESGGRHYSVRFIPLMEFTPFVTGYLVVLADVTEAVQHIHAVAWQSVRVGVVGALVLEAILFLLLSAPLSRLRRTAQMLPALARGGFGEVRLGLAPPPPTRHLRDEIDLLDETAIGLASQLETLSRKVGERTEALKLRMRDLDRERSFITSLLDTAKVMILTLTPQGRVGLANRYTLELTGYELVDLVGRPFFDLLAPEEQGAGVVELGRVLRREVAHYSHEAELVCASGRRLYIAWLHSILDSRDEGEGLVLSAGLDITERKHAERRIAWLADHDPLTGLVNRRRFELAAQQALRGSLTRREIGGALMYLDLDQFKLINDTSGHSAGDRVLEIFAGNLARLGDSICPGRETLVARLGGDEFAVLVDGVGREDALHAAERLRDGLTRFQYHTGKDLFKISCCIGVALFPEHGMGFQELMQNADLAMYQAKALGEGRVQMFSGDAAVRNRLVHRRQWRDRIQEALEGGRFFLRFQPILELATGRVTHLEALVRMLGADGRGILPNEFIPVAEATGQITAIDCRVLDLAFETWPQLQAAHGYRGLHINLSARTFQTSEWLTHLDRLLEGGADPAAFLFEITETAAVTDLKDAQMLMNLVRAKGCRFALDDFGIGFSSFNYVKELPVDLVKIDGAFISRLAERRDHQIIVRALVDAARGFGKQTVAEFVDSRATLDMLRVLEVDFAQGHHIARPVSVARLLRQAPSADGANGDSEDAEGVRVSPRPGAGPAQSTVPDR